jgi:hypothetical protein
MIRRYTKLSRSESFLVRCTVAQTAERESPGRMLLLYGFCERYLGDGPTFVQEIRPLYGTSIADKLNVLKYKIILILMFMFSQRQSGCGTMQSCGWIPTFSEEHISPYSETKCLGSEIGRHVGKIILYSFILTAICSSSRPSTQFVM